MKKINWEKELVRWHSKYVRARDGNKCMLHETAHKLKIKLPMKCAGVMQCCHKISRSKASIKYHDKNVFCGCSGSNLWASFHQDDWREICLELWADDMKELDVLKRMVCKRSNIDKQNLAMYFKEKYSLLVI